MKVTRESFEKKTMLCGHHLIGAKSAVVRFSGILNIDIPRSIQDVIKGGASKSKGSGIK
jgi:hypothetical protein